MNDRTDIYAALDKERDYQDARWGKPSGGKHSVAEYVLYLEHHIGESRRVSSTQADPQAKHDALDQIRKIAALCVACMEDNGIVHRT